MRRLEDVRATANASPNSYGSGDIGGTMVNVPSVHTSTAAPCFPLRGMTALMVFPSKVSQFPSSPETVS